MNTVSDPVKVELVVRDGCRYSDRVLDEMQQMSNNFPEMMVEVVAASDPQKGNRPRGGITPSIWVNGKLWFLGTFCPKKFTTKMSELLKAN